MIYKRILLPVDGSPHSFKAVEHAKRLAQGGGSIIVLTVVSEVPRLLGGEARIEAEREAIAEADVLLDPVINSLRQADLQVEGRTVFANHPGNAILVAIAETGCDVVVMGSRGLSDLEGLVMGSVTHRVLSLSKVPVLVVNEA